MKDMKHTMMAVAAAMLLVAGCQSRQNEAIVKKSSSGKTCEVLLAADRTVYIGATKELLDSLLREPQPGLPQDEPRFDVVNVPVSSLHNTAMFQAHRNIIMCDVAEGNPDKLYIGRDKWASPQVMVDVAASSDSSLRRLLRQHAVSIRRAIYDAEHKRIEAAFMRDRNVDLMKRVKDKFGFEMVLQQDYKLASEDGDFMWIRKETKDFGLGVLLSVSPYRDQAQLDAARIDNRLDTLMRRHVPGPAEGSYMGTERRMEIEHHRADYAGVPYCVETRGLWRLFGDFMGGPFVCYTMLTPDGTKIVDAVGYVYCPRFDKRDYLMQVEGICNSIKFDQ